MTIVAVLNMNAANYTLVCEIRRSNNREFCFLQQMELTALSLQFVMAFYHRYWTHIPELIEKIRGGVCGGGRRIE
jgi:hypothetical protein